MKEESEHGACADMLWVFIRGDLLSVRHMVRFFANRQNISAPKGPSSVAQEYKTEQHPVRS